MEDGVIPSVLTLTQNHSNRSAAEGPRNDAVICTSGTAFQSHDIHRSMISTVFCFFPFYRTTNAASNAIGVYYSFRGS